jgi:hypothetical protein
MKKAESKRSKNIKAGLGKSHSLSKKKIELGVKKPTSLLNKAKRYGVSNLLTGCSLGIDKDGYFIYTHRGRSKSHKNPATFTVKEIRFVESTG